MRLAGCTLFLVAALSACVSVREPTPPPPGLPVHFALVWKRYELICLGADDDDDGEAFEREIDRRYGARYEAVLAALKATYGEEALASNWIDVDGCRTDRSGIRLTQAYLSELRAWETKLKLR